MAGTKDIKDFTKYPSLSDNDYILGTKTDLNGTDAGITVVNLKKLVAQDVKPEIKNGYWWVNNINTGVLALGKTPKFRYSSQGLEMKYENEDDTAYRVLIPVEDLFFTFDDLTPEQVESLKLKFSDLTEADKKELRGKAFVYDDFTPEQLTDLRLTWQKLTPDQKKELQGERGYSAFEVWEQQEGNTGKTVDDYLAWLTSAASDIRQEMNQINEEAEDVIRNTNAVKEEADKATVRANKAAEAAEGIVAGIVPTKLSDLYNDTGFVTNAVNDLTNYYLKSETYTQEEVLNLISQIKNVSILPVEVLPDTGETNIIYFLSKEGEEGDVYNEYIWLNEGWELLGSTSVDLSSYYTKDEANNRYVLKEAGKRLMTDEEGVKLEGVEDGANKYVLPTGNGFNFIPADGNVGQVLANSASGAAEWVDNVEGGLFIGSVQIKSINATNDPETFSEFINGYTMADFDNAIENQTPIYSVLKNMSGINYGYARAISIVKELDGTSIAYVMVFELSMRASSGRMGVEYLSVYLQGVQNSGWRFVTVRGTQIGGNYTPVSGNEIIFSGGYYEMGIYSEALTVFTIVSPWYFPMQNSTTTLLIQNSNSNEKTFSLVLGASATADGSKLLFANELPSIPGYHAVEVSILWANWRYVVRFSEPFDYRNYIE